MTISAGKVSPDKLTALCSERKTIKDVLVPLMRPLLTLGVLSMEVRVVVQPLPARGILVTLAFHPTLGTLEDSRTLLVNIPTKLPTVRCTRVTWQFADEETECANFLKRCDAPPRPLLAKQQPNACRNG